MHFGHWYDGNSLSVECCLETTNAPRRQTIVWPDTIVCSSQRSTRSPRTTRALHTRWDYKLTSLGALREKIDSFHFLTQKSRRVLPYISLTGIGLKKGIGSGFGESDGTPPPRIPRNTPRRENRRYFINWAGLRPAQFSNNQGSQHLL